MIVKKLATNYSHLRRLCVGLALAAVIPAMASAEDASANTFPNKPVRLVVGSAAGGSTDMIARLLAEKLSIAWRQPVIVENVTGAGGSIGAMQVARANPDGYTLMMQSDSIVLNIALLKKPPYSLNDFAGVVKAIVNAQILVVRPTLGVKTFKQYVELAKKNPGQVSLALPLSGGIAHIAHEMIRQNLGIDVNYIPYRGGGPAAVDVMAGHVDATLITLAAVTEYIKAGRLTPLVVTTSYRSPVLPDVPTVAESGIPGFNVESWFGILVPAKTPRPIVDKINRDMLEILANSETKKQIESMGSGVTSSTPQEFDASLRADLARYTQVIKTAGITLR